MTQASLTRWCKTQSLRSAVGTDVTNYPAAVGLRFHNGKSCTGALIAPDAIATAAHCLNDLIPATGGYLDISAFSMIGGVRRTITDDGTTGDDKLRRVWVRWDPQYVPGSFDAPSDFAVLVLAAGDGASFRYVSVSECAATNCRMPIYADAIGVTRNITLYGSGMNSTSGAGVGVMRTGRKYIDGWSADRNYFTRMGPAATLLRYARAIPVVPQSPTRMH